MHHSIVEPGNFADRVYVVVAGGICASVASSLDVAVANGDNGAPAAVRRQQGERVASNDLRIFINYRQDDWPGSAGRLHDRLALKLAPEQFFMDVDAIAPGIDFDLPRLSGPKGMLVQGAW